MDISAEREREQSTVEEQPEPRQLTREEMDHAIITWTGRPTGESVIEFTPEEVARVQAADEFIQTGLQILEDLSTPDNRYGVPENIEQVALVNALFGLMVEKGVCTMAEAFVAKREAIAEQMEKIVLGARAHKQQQSSLVVPDDPGAAMAAITQPVPQQQSRRRRGRRR